MKLFSRMTPKTPGARDPTRYRRTQEDGSTSLMLVAVVGVVVAKFYRKETCFGLCFNLVADEQQNEEREFVWFTPKENGVND